MGGRLTINALEGKVVLISGTAGGQGRAAALAFTREGASVLGCDLKTNESEETLAMVNREGGQMRSMHPLDVSEAENAQAWAKSAHDTWGQIDVLYNNASSLRAKGPFAESTLEEWNLTLRYELTSIYIASHAVWPYMVEGAGGLIINTASVFGHQEQRPFRTAAHGTAKAGVIAFTRMLAAEGVPHGIRAVSISPGLIRTPATEELWTGDNPRLAGIGEELVRKIPLGRPGKSEEIASLAVFLASPGAGYINGTDIVVDGGVLGLSWGGADR